MIKFFRNIRRAFIEEGKTNNYIKYAIGEIVLVVLGILIALQINNWNHQRLDRRLEVEILTGIEEELANVEKRLLFWSNFNDIKYSLATKVLSYNENNASKLTMDSLFSCLLFVNVFDKGGGPLEAIINSGRLELIQDKDIRRLLASWPDKLEDIHTNDLSNRDVVWRELLPYLSNFGIPEHECDSVVVFCTADTPISDNYKTIVEDKKFSAMLRTRRKLLMGGSMDLQEKAQSAKELRLMIHEYLNELNN